MNTPNTNNESSELPPLWMVAARSMYHDINNILTPMNGNIELIKMYCKRHSIDSSVYEGVLAAANNCMDHSQGLKDHFPAEENSIGIQEEGLKDKLAVYAAEIQTLHAQAEQLLEATTDEFIRTRLELAVSISNKAMTYVESLQLIMATKEVVSSPEQLQVFNIVDEARVQLLSVLQERNLTVESTVELPELYYDRLYFERIVFELLHNATKYCDPNTKITITHALQNDVPTFTVTSMGQPIPEDQLQTIFKQGERLEQHADVEGTGTGLAGIKAMVEQEGGTITATSTPQGNTFTVRF